MNQRQAVLVVEPRAPDTVAPSIARLGFAVTTCDTPEAALFEYGRRDVDVVVAAMPLPGMGTMALSGEIRRRGRTPILITTTNGGGRWVDALDAGADDHLALPCDQRELEARLRALTRRSRGSLSPARILTIGALTIRCDAAGLHLDPPIGLSATQATILDRLAAQPNVIISERVLMARIRAFDDGVNATTVMAELLVLQGALASAAQGTEVLQCADDGGWRLIAQPLTT